MFFPINKTLLIGTSALILSFSTNINADETSPPKLWSGDIEFGYVSTTGNTQETTAKNRTDLNRENGYWRYNFTLEALNSESKGVASAEKYFLSNKLAYQLTENNFVFGYASYDDDRFSGFDYQASATLGFGRRIINNEKMQWDIELGPGYRYSKVDDSSMEDNQGDVILGGYTRFIWDFSETSTFSQLLNVESGGGNTITKSTTGLKVQVNGSISIKLSYSVKYTDDVPLNSKHADTESAVTLTYSL